MSLTPAFKPVLWVPDKPKLFKQLHWIFAPAVVLPAFAVGLDEAEALF